jgi:pSer/pThr/pTyr-binding forkhead associated (FHA) protein
MTADSPSRERPHPVSARELKAVLLAEREGTPFFIYRDRSGEQRIVGLSAQRTEFTVGRNFSADLSLDWDDQVSGVHAVIERLAGELMLLDDGLSRNGSFVNDERVHGRRRLRDGDLLRFGRTTVLVRNPADAGRSTTAPAPAPVEAVLSDQQRRVLSALCRPLHNDEPLSTLPTNREIAGELYLSVGAVKLHLRALFVKFGIAHLPQNKKRLALAQAALHSGLLTDRERT